MLFPTILLSFTCIAASIYAHPASTPTKNGTPTTHVDTSHGAAAEMAKLGYKNFHYAHSSKRSLAKWNYRPPDAVDVQNCVTPSGYPSPPPASHRMTFPVLCQVACYCEPDGAMICDDTYQSLEPYESQCRYDCECPLPPYIPWKPNPKIPPPPPPPGGVSVSIVTPHGYLLGHGYCNLGNTWCLVAGNPDGTANGLVQIVRTAAAAGYEANGSVSEYLDGSDPIVRNFHMDASATTATLPATGEIYQLDLNVHDEL